MDTAGSFDVNNPIVQITCSRTSFQQFRVDTASLADGTFQIVSCAGRSCDFTGVTSSDLCVGANPTGVNGRAVDHDSITLMRCRDGSGLRPFNSQWRIDSHDFDRPVSYAHFRSALPTTDSAGKCIDVPSGVTWDNVQLQLFHCHGGDNQTWQLINY